MDPSTELVTIVRRRTLRTADDLVERLEVADGKRWRLPSRSEVGGGSREVARDFDPGRTHRWVPV